MSVIVTKTFITTCPGELISEINQNGTITPNLEQIVWEGGASSVFYFATALSIADEVELDSVLGAWLCPTGGPDESTSNTDTVNDNAEPDPDVIWSSNKIQAELDLKSNEPHDHPASHIVSGTLDLARLPTGQTSTTVALGNHTHPYSPVEHEHHYYKHHSTGLMFGGLVTVNSTNNDKFDLSAGHGTIVDYNDPESPVITDVAWTAFTNIALPFLPTNLATYISMDINGDIQHQITPWTAADHRNRILIATIGHMDNATICGIEPHTIFGQDPIGQIGDIACAIGKLNLVGNEFKPISTTLTMEKSVGQTFSFGSNLHVDNKTPNFVANPAIALVDFAYVKRDGAGNYVEQSTTTLIDPNSLDDGTGTLAAVPAGKFTTQTIFFFPTSGQVRLEYGYHAYDTLAEAMASVPDKEHISPPQFTANGVLRGWVITKAGTTDLGDTADAAIIAATKFGGSSGSAGTSGGSGSGATILNELGDVDTATTIPLLGHLLEFDGALWQPAAHDHSAEYSGIAHEHDADYSAIGHSHPEVHFGEEADFAESIPWSQTSSTSYKQKIRLTTANLAAGTYRIGWSYRYHLNNYSRDFKGRIQINDSSTIGIHRQEPQDSGTDQGYRASGFAYYSLSGVNNIDIDYCSSSSDKTAFICEARLEIWKINTVTNYTPGNVPGNHPQGYDDDD